MTLAIRRSTIAVLATAVLLFAGNGATFRFPAANAAVWLSAYAAVLYWLARTPGPALRSLRAAWPLLLLPLLALASPLWSVNPPRSAAAAFQLLMTMLIAIRIAGLLGPRAIFTALFIAQSAGLALSLANAATNALPPAWEVHGPLLGIYVQKGWMGKAAFWWAFSATALGLWYRHLPLALAATALAAALALKAESVLALLAFAAIGLMLLFATARRLPPTLGPALPLGAATLALGLAAIANLTGGDLVSATLDGLGKSGTLTGRTVLWDIGLGAWSDSPLLGTGYGAFWSSATYAWEIAFVHATVDSGLAGFHNAYVEALVSLGLAGAVLFAVLIVATLQRLTRWYLATTSPDATIWLAACAAILLMGLMDDYFFRQHAPHLVLFAAAFLHADPARWRVRPPNRRNAGPSAAGTGPHRPPATRPAVP
ncbi:O-antigen ligase family protein [Algicella marina]|uniref:O-antigen ligase-related domain-containing protein n=1 Tax=Algicella marina TaxID=2683284 RepID=A0A6P1T4J2_9RHOB|nr:O-antigen ligase family protein [Algicella marina]QHQ36416.1 hypothetical protein GO499_15150 [Algicella marina]